MKCADVKLKVTKYDRSIYRTFKIHQLFRNIMCNSIIRVNKMHKILIEKYRKIHLSLFIGSQKTKIWIRRTERTQACLEDKRAFSGVSSSTECRDEVFFIIILLSAETRLPVPLLDPKTQTEKAAGLTAGIVCCGMKSSKTSQRWQKNKKNKWPGWLYLQ